MTLSRLSLSKWLETAEEVAETYYNGNLTIMRFGVHHWECSFGDAPEWVGKGMSAQDAISEAVRKDRFNRTKRGAVSSDESFAAYLKRLREAAGFGVQDLAIEAGCSHSFIYRIEQGKRYPSLMLCKKLSMALNVSLHEIVDKACEFEFEE